MWVVTSSAYSVGTEMFTDKSLDSYDTLKKCINLNQSKKSNLNHVKIANYEFGHVNMIIKRKFYPTSY